MKMKLTQRSVAAITTPDPTGKQQLYWDTELKGFGVLVSGVSDAKTYVVKGSVGGLSVRRKIGRVDLLTVASAREKAKEMLLALRSGRDPLERRAATVQAALDQYLAARPSLRPRSLENYRDAFRVHLSDWLGLPLSSITRSMIENRHRDIQGPAAANGAMRAFRAVWNHAADRDPDLPPNPVRLRGQWHRLRPRERCVRADDMAGFYQAVMALPNAVGRDYLLLISFTGLCRREAATLRWTDVDLQGKVLRIPAAATKAGRRLDLPMTDFVHDLLVARRSLGDATFVFPAASRSGHVEEPRVFLDAIAGACGIQVSCHDLRRTYVTTAEGCDISPIALRALVNHSLGRDVTSGYIQMTAERLREPAQRVCENLKALCGIVEPIGNVVAFS